jgi:hypothetical protein
MTNSRQAKPSIPAIPPSTAFLDPIPGIVPHGALVQFVGPPKCGKTAVLAAFLQRLRDGRTICGLPTHRPPSLGIITTDHKWRLNQGLWFDKVGFSEVPHVCLRDDAAIKWPTLKGRGNGAPDLLKQSLETLQALGGLEPGGLVAIDVAGVFISTRLNDYNEVLAGIGSMSQVLDRFHATAFLLGHMGKQKSDPKDRYLRPHERILGSGALIGFTDTTMYMLGPEDTGKPYHTFGWLPTHAPMGEFQFQRNPETGLFEPYTGKLLPDVSPELLAVVEALPLPPETFRTNLITNLIIASCRVRETQAKERLKLLEASGLILDAGRGLFLRARIS